MNWNILNISEICWSPSVRHNYQKWRIWRPTTSLTTSPTIWALRVFKIGIPFHSFNDCWNLSLIYLKYLQITNPFFPTDVRFFRRQIWFFTIFFNWLTKVNEFATRQYLYFSENINLIIFRFWDWWPCIL